jgi:general secretion pathway protein F
MPQYEVTGANANGKTVKVYVEGDSVRAARLKAKSMGIVPLDVVASDGSAKGGGASQAPEDDKLPNVSILGGISTGEIANLTRQLAVLVKAHVPVVESLSAMIEQIEKAKLRKILINIRQVVKEGLPLHQGFGRYPKQFDRVYINMVKAGESSGKLDVVLMRLADFYENAVKQRNKVLGALTYPIIIMLVAVGAIALIFTKVIPTITQIFDDQKQALPLATEILIKSSEFFNEYTWHLAIGVLGILVLGERYVKTPAGRARKDSILLTAPIIGPLTRALAVARFARTLGTLLQSGVPMIQSLEIAKNVVNNSLFEDAITKAATAVEEGRSLALSLKQSRQFPPIVIHMVGVGEKTGELEPMLMNVAESYELQVDTAVGALTSVLSPLMIVLMVIFVGFVMMAVLVPILEMGQGTV